MSDQDQGFTCYIELRTGECFDIWVLYENHSSQDQFIDWLYAEYPDIECFEMYTDNDQ